MPNITKTSVDAAVPEFWAQIALGALKSNTVMSRLVNRDYDSAVATAGDTVNITKRGGLTVNDKAINTPITLQAPTNAKIPVTLDSHKEVSWLVEDSASATAIDDAINYVTDAAIAIGEQIDGDLTGLYTEASLAETNVNRLSVANILAVRGLLNTAKCPMAGRNFVIGVEDDVALLGLEQFTSSEWAKENEDGLINASLGRKYGFNFFMDQNIQEVTGVAKNLAFQRDALVLVTRPLPIPPADKGVMSAIIEADGIAIRVSSSYSHKDLGTIWTLDVLYGVAGMRDDTNIVVCSNSDAV